MIKKYALGVLSILSYNVVISQITFKDQASIFGIAESCGSTFLGNGVSFYDFDQDGWDDITLNSQDGDDLRFFKNINGNFVEQFLNIASVNHQTKQVNWVDIDNDGDKDLFVTSDTDGNKLFENTGNLVFQDITSSSGMNTANTFSYGASWGDYNNDGYLDVFISNRSLTIPNILYKNNGNNTFTNENSLAGISTAGHMSFCSAFLDINNDGWQDIYVSNDKNTYKNLLYKNNGDGTFTDISMSSGTDVGIDAMSVTVGDFNNDSWQDIYVTNGVLGNVFFRNNGNETFTDIAGPTGTIFNSVGWGATFLDADNDMDLDLYVSSEFDQSITNFLNAAFYINNNNGTFTLNNTSFPNDNRRSFSNALGDINNDGFGDLIVSNNNFENIFLWENITSNTNNWLKVNLNGVQSNSDGIGSVIEISINGDKQYRYTHCGEGYLAQNSGTEFFGLGSNSTVDYVKVKWLSGIEDTFYNVSSNQTLNVEEGSATLEIVDYNKDEKISVFPNPVLSTLTVKTESIIEKIVVSNILGEEVLRISPKSLNSSVDLNHLTTGIYIVNIELENTSRVMKIIKK
ncbi:hypothetical protein A9Q87_00710 [Flavobacteriales bacterium 34_180_T64]|nr:hypothetical protein A9Q87_00710 [Flavobacteriales bacterium 34_180_T64]